MNNVLVGNGINIEFGGYKNYSNSAILKRLMKNCKTKNYNSILKDFNITNEELLQFFEGLHSIVLKKVLSNEYDYLCTSKEDKIILKRFKLSYDKDTTLYDVGMEDYFFLMKLFHDEYNDGEQLRIDVFHGMCYLLADAIYCNGEIQSILKNIENNKQASLSKFFSKFDNVFTVNYDMNLEYVYPNPVYYLHGDFKTLLPQYDTKYLEGKVQELYGRPNYVNDDNKHFMSTCLFGFSGARKNHIQDIYNNVQTGIDNIEKYRKCGLSEQDEKLLNSYKNHAEKKYRYAYQLMTVALQHPDLKLFQYPTKFFNNAEGDMHIIGMSPNNDDHIWNNLLNNSKINKIIYYYKSIKTKELLEELYPNANIHYENIEKVWNGEL